VFLSIREISKKWSMPIRDWGIIIGQLMIFFEDRLSFRKAY
jgi:putative transposase